MLFRHHDPRIILNGLTRVDSGYFLCPAPFTELENPNFYVIENTYIEIDVEELSVILNNNAYRKVDEDDEIDHENNGDDKVGHANDENIEEDFD